MTDYLPLLSRAVSGLERNTGEARRSVYDRARQALLKQLRSMNPPLAESEITRERLALEEAIRRIETQTTRPPERAAPPPSPAPPPRMPEPEPVEEDVKEEAEVAEADAPPPPPASPPRREPPAPPVRRDPPAREAKPATPPSPPAPRRPAPPARGEIPDDAFDIDDLTHVAESSGLAAARAAHSGAVDWQSRVRGSAPRTLSRPHRCSCQGRCAQGAEGKADRGRLDCRPVPDCAHHHVYAA
jgi:hypothetical protein